MSQPSLAECPRCFPEPSTPVTLLRRFDALYSSNHLLCVTCTYTTQIVEDIFSETVSIFTSIENDKRKSFEWVWHDVHDEIMKKFISWKLPPDYTGRTKREGEEGEGEDGDGDGELSPGRVERIQSLKGEPWYERGEPEVIKPWYESDSSASSSESQDVSQKVEEVEEEEKDDLPRAVMKYTLSAFSELNQIEGIGWRETNRKLQESIDEAREEGTLWTRDWGKMLLPQQVLQNERDETW